MTNRLLRTGDSKTEHNLAAFSITNEEIAVLTGERSAARVAWLMPPEAEIFSESDAEACLRLAEERKVPEQD